MWVGSWLGFGWFGCLGFWVLICCFVLGIACFGVLDFVVYVCFDVCVCFSCVFLVCCVNFGYGGFFWCLVRGVLV